MRIFLVDPDMITCIKITCINTTLYNKFLANFVIRSHSNLALALPSNPLLLYIYFTSSTYIFSNIDVLKATPSLCMTVMLRWQKAEVLFSILPLFSVVQVWGNSNNLPTFLMRVTRYIPPYAVFNKGSFPCVANVPAFSVECSRPSPHAPVPHLMVIFLSISQPSRCTIISVFSS